MNNTTYIEKLDTPHTSRQGQMSPRAVAFSSKTIKIFVLLIWGCFINVSIAAFSQELSLSFKNASLDQVLREVRKQSGYNYFLNADILKKSKPISINVKNQTLQSALQTIFAQQPLGYRIKGNNIVVEVQSPQADVAPRSDNQQTVVEGRVVDSLGQNIVGATVKALQSGVTTHTAPYLANSCSLT